MDARSTTNWQINEHCELHWRSWEEEFIVFDSRSGDTHLLNLVAARVLKKLERGPANSADLAEHIAVFFEIELNQGFESTLKRLLDDFYSKGLIEPINT